MAVRAVICAVVGVCLGIAPLWSQSSPSQSDLETLARRAQELLRSNRPDLAEREYEAILALDGNNLDARGNLGVVRFFQGKYAESIPELRRALQLQSSLWKIQALLGMAEKRTGETVTARADLENAFPRVQEQKLRVETGLELIELYYGSNELDKAAAVVSELKRLEPTNVEILYTAHQIYGELADESMLSIGMLAPKSARMHQLMAHEMARQGDTQGAIAQFREAAKVDPQRPGLRFELAEMLTNSANRADQDEAEQEYKAALAANPFDERAERRLGDIAARRADLKDAYAHYTRAVKLQPDDADADLGLAKTLIAMNEPEKAQPLLEHSAQLDPFNVVTRYHLAAIYKRLGRAEDARRELAEFRKLKDMKQQLREVYKEMRVEPVHQERQDPEVPN